MVTEHVGGDPAEPEYHYRAEHRFLDHADDGLDAAGDHGLDEHAGHPAGEPGLQAAHGGAHLVGPVQVELDGAGGGSQCRLIWRRLGDIGGWRPGPRSLSEQLGAGEPASHGVFTPPTLMIGSADGKESIMKAQVGDELVVKGRHVGDPDRKGVIIEVHGEAGGPPYLVRWSDGHESSFYPTTGTVAEHIPLPANGRPRTP